MKALKWLFKNHKWLIFPLGFFGILIIARHEVAPIAWYVVSVVNIAAWIGVYSHYERTHK